jgi:hypothetical protein
MFNRNIEKSLAVNVVKRGTGSKLYSKDFSMVKQGQHKLIMAKMVVRLMRFCRVLSGR